jgi:hypothetical protein
MCQALGQTQAASDGRRICTAGLVQLPRQGLRILGSLHVLNSLRLVFDVMRPLGSACAFRALYFMQFFLLIAGMRVGAVSCFPCFRVHFMLFIGLWRVHSHAMACYLVHVAVAWVLPHVHTHAIY